MGDACNFAEPSPAQHTNNSAELWAVHHVWRAKEHGRRVAVVMDSEYVYKGLTEHALGLGEGGWWHADL